MAIDGRGGKGNLDDALLLGVGGSLVLGQQLGAADSLQMARYGIGGRLVLNDVGHNQGALHVVALAVQVAGQAWRLAGCMAEVGGGDSVLAHDEVGAGRAVVEGGGEEVDEVVGTGEASGRGVEVQAGGVRLAQVVVGGAEQRGQARTRRWRRGSRARCCGRRGRRAARRGRRRMRRRETLPFGRR